jgi:hypothetical protein
VTTDGPQEMPALKARLIGHKKPVQEMSKKRYEFWVYTQIVAAVAAIVMLFMFAMAPSESSRAINTLAFWVAISAILVANYQKSKAPRWKNEPRDQHLFIFK